MSELSGQEVADSLQAWIDDMNRLRRGLYAAIQAQDSHQIDALWDELEIEEVKFANALSNLRSWIAEKRKQAQASLPAAQKARTQKIQQLLRNLEPLRVGTHTDAYQTKIPLYGSPRVAVLTPGSPEDKKGSDAFAIGLLAGHIAQPLGGNLYFMQGKRIASVPASFVCHASPEAVQRAVTFANKLIAPVLPDDRAYRAVDEKLRRMKVDLFAFTLADARELLQQKRLQHRSAHRAEKTDLERLQEKFKRNPVRRLAKRR